MKKTKIVEIERSFSSPYIDEKLLQTKHHFILGGKNDKRERLAIAIAESNTPLSYQPRYWAKQALQKMIEDNTTYTLLIRNRIDYMHEIYRIDQNGKIELIAPEVTEHRANRIVTYYYARKHLYNPNIWDNYCHNGYTTQIGLDRLIHKDNIAKKCGRIAMSHILYTNSGQAAHNQRVAYRN